MTGAISQDQTRGASDGKRIVLKPSHFQIAKPKPLARKQHLVHSESMALYLRLDKNLYGVLGTVPLKRGDAWSIQGNVVDKYSGFEQEKDMTSRSATAYFPGKDAVIAKSVSFPTPLNGAFTVSLTPTESAETALCDSGCSFYIVTDQNETIETVDEPLEIKDRGFSQD